MNPDLTGFRSLYRSTAAPAVATTTAVRPAWAGVAGRRSAVLVANCSATATLYVKFVPRGAPAVTATDFHDLVSPGDARLFGYGETFDVYVAAGSGTAAHHALELGY